MIKYINSRKIKYLFVLFFLNIGLAKSFENQFYIGSNFTHNTIEFEVEHEHKSRHTGQWVTDLLLKTEKQNKDIYSIGAGYKMFLFGSNVFFSPELFINLNKKIVSKTKYEYIENIYSASMKEIGSLNSKFGYHFNKLGFSAYFIFGFSRLKKLEGEFVQSVFNNKYNIHMHYTLNFGFGAEYIFRNVGINFSVVKSVANKDDDMPLGGRLLFPFFEALIRNRTTLDYGNTKLSFGVNYYFGGKIENK